LKKTALILLLGLTFGACKNEKMPEPGISDPNCYPKTVTRTVSFSNDVITTKFTYDSGNKITQEAVFSNNILSRTGYYVYNAAGNLTGKNYYSGGQLTEQNDYTLNADGKPVKLSHSYVNAGGVASLHHFRMFDYTPEGKIEKITDFTPTGQILSGVSYEHSSEGFIKTVSFGQNGTFSSKDEITFDGHNHPFSATANHNNGLLRNEITHLVKDSADKVMNTITNTITYNPKNYPVKIIQSHSGGLVLTETFTY
jgi:antitoxin component YwqK of YwqJK toxin-antitoxin module